jgi:lipoprotein-anchoring transpeptidase ErfK/SrfK
MQSLPARATLLTGALLSIVLTGCASRVPSPAKESPSQNSTLAMQIFLDSKGFGPGVVDGRPGEFTTKAMSLYQQSRGLPAESRPEIETRGDYATYAVTDKDLGALGTAASGPEEQSRREKLSYTSLSELLSERYHTTQKFLRDLNPGTDLNSLAAGAPVTVPDIGRPFRFDAFPSTYPAPSEATAANRRVIVDLRQKFLQILENGRIIAGFPITPGSSAHPAPAGEWRIVGAVPWPWYRHDEGVLSRGERTEDFLNLPPGPNSPVGILWAGLNRPGVGIHGTPVPDTIGRAGSHGCIRLSNWDAATFHTLVSKGTPVTIR